MTEDCLHLSYDDSDKENSSCSSQVTTPRSQISLFPTQQRVPFADITHQFVLLESTRRSSTRATVRGKPSGPSARHLR